MINANGTLFAGTDGGGTYRFVSGSTIWSQVNYNMTAFVVNTLVIDVQARILAGTDDGIFRSADDGDSWEAVNEGLTNGIILSSTLAPNGDIFIGTDGSGVFRH